MVSRADRKVRSSVRPPKEIVRVPRIWCQHTKPFLALAPNLNHEQRSPAAHPICEPAKTTSSLSLRPSYPSTSVIATGSTSNTIRASV